MAESLFVRELKRELELSRGNDYADNYDVVQLGAEPPAPPPMWRVCGAEIKARLKELARRTVFRLRPYLSPLKRMLLYYFLPRRFL